MDDPELPWRLIFFDDHTATAYLENQSLRWK